METCRDVAETCGDGNTRKKAKVDESLERVDRISSLPDSVLIHILSLLPTRDAIRTLMIPSFGRLWTQTYNIDFDWCMYHKCSDDSLMHFDYDKWSLARFVAFVHCALMFHRSPRIFRFRLNFEYSMEDELELDDVEPVDLEKRERAVDMAELSAEINSWIEFALKRNVEVFDLDFLACGLPGPDIKYDLPSSVLQSNSLVELKLVSCDLKLSSQSYMKALKVLYLKEIVLSDSVMDNILSGCPMLENLSLVDCYGLRKLTCASQNLKRVVVAPDILDELLLKVSCPYITSLSIAGWIERVELKNLASLYDASIDFCDCFICVPDEYIEVQRIIKKLVHVKVLTMYQRPILVMMIWELLGLQCPSSKWHCLILNTILTKWHLYGIINLLRNSPCLETLEIHILSGDLPTSITRDSWLQLEKVTPEEYWRSLGEPFECLMNTLKIVKVSGDVTKDTALQLLQFLLGNALVLEKLSIVTAKPKDQSTAVDGWKEFAEKLLKFPRAAAGAAISFAEK